MFLVMGIKYKLCLIKVHDYNRTIEKTSIKQYNNRITEVFFTMKTRNCNQNKTFPGKNQVCLYNILTSVNKAHIIL